MNDKVEGLVLKISDYKENDLLIDCLTSDHLFFSFVARGSKKTSSHHHFYNFCLYEFLIDYKDNKTMYTVYDRKLLENYYDDNMKLMAFKDILAEVSIKSKELDDYKMFEHLLFVFRNINSKNCYLLGSLYLSYILKISGISPEVDRCVMCSNKKVVSISKRLGGFVCLNHVQGEDLMEVETLKKFRLINKATFENYDVIKDIEFSFDDFRLLVEFYELNSEINLKSFKIYRELFG